MTQFLSFFFLLSIVYIVYCLKISLSYVFIHNLFPFVLHTFDFIFFYSFFPSPQLTVFVLFFFVISVDYNFCRQGFNLSWMLHFCELELILIWLVFMAYQPYKAI